MNAARLVVAACLAFAALAAGCDTTPTAGGYEMRSRYPKEYRTIAVTLFRNDTYDRPLNGQLTEALIKEVQAMTPYHLASDARADTLLRGTVRRRDLRELSKSRGTGLSEEMALNVTVDYEWVDQRTGKPLVQRNGFRESAVFVASLPIQQPIDLARFQVVEQLATAIVDSMQADW